MNGESAQDSRPHYEGGTQGGDGSQGDVVDHSKPDNQSTPTGPRYEDERRNRSGGSGMDLQQIRDSPLMQMLGGMSGQSSGSSSGGSGMAQSIDPGIVALLNDRGNNGNLGGNELILLFLVLFAMGNGGGFGGMRSNSSDVVNEANYSRMLDAISAQGTRQEVAMQGLASTLNCDVSAIQAALCGMDKAIAMSQGSVTSAIQSCCCNVQGAVSASQNAIQTQLAECCCQTQRAIERQGCDTRQAVSDLAYNMASQFAAQTSALQAMDFANRNYLDQQFNAIEAREHEKEIQALRDQVADLRATAQTSVLLNAIERARTGTTPATSAEAGGTTTG